MAFKLPQIEAAIQMVDNVTAPMRKINQAIESANAPVKRLSDSLGALSKEAKLSALGSSLGNLKGKLSGVGDGFSKSFGRAQSVLLAGGGAIAALSLFVKKTADAGDAVADISQRVGVSSDMLQRWRYAAQLSGSSVETMDLGIERFSKNLSAAAAGTGEALGPLKAMGIRLKDNSGRLRSQEDILLDVADAMQKIPDAEDRLRVSSALFGKGSQNLVTMLGEGRDGLQGMFSDFQKMGGGFDQKTLQGAADFNDNMDKLGFTISSLAASFASQLFPILNETITRFQVWAASNKDTIKQFAEGFAARLPVLIESVGTALMNLAKAAGPVVDAITRIMDTFGPAKVIFGSLAAFISGPFIVSLLAVIPSLISLGSTISATLAAVGGVSGILAAVGGAFTAFSGVITATVLPAIYSIGTALLTTPVGWILAAIAAIAGAVYLIWKNWDTVSGWIMSAWGKVSAFLDTSIGKILAVFVFPLIGIPLLIIKHWDVIWGWLQGLWGRITAFLQTTVDQILLTFVTPFIGLLERIYQNWGAIVQWFSDLWAQVSAFFDTGVGQAVAMLVPFIRIPLMIYKHWEGIKDFFSGLWDGIQAGFSAFIDGFLGAWDWLNGAVDLAIKKLADMVSGVPIIGDVLSKAVSFFGTDAQPTGAEAAQAPAQNYRAVNETRTSVTRQESTVAVNFQNLPAGARVAQPQGEAPVKVSSGFAFAGGF